MANMDNITDKLKILPELPGCYLMKNKDQEIIYVGKAKKLKNRVRSYFVGVHNYKTTKLVQEIDDFEYIVTGSEKEALLLEINLIKEHTPKYNIMFMDDRTYPYLKLTKEKAPILKVTRTTKDRKAIYFGPFPDAGAAYETMRLLNQLYPLRKCKTLPKKECLYYHIKQCLGPCIHDIDPEIFMKMSEDIRKFLKGDVKDIIMRLQHEMEEASKHMQFELAQEKLTLIKSIQHVTSKQQIDFKDRKDRDAFGYYVDKGYISIQGFFVRGGKLLERTLSITPLYADEKEAFISFILQYYQIHPLPQEILLSETIDKEALAEVLNTNILIPKRGDKRKLVEMVEANAKNVHEQKFNLVKHKEDRRVEALAQLSEIFHKDIHTIEMFDNSHISGTFNVSGMIVFKDGMPSKKDYRLFKLDTYRSDMDSMKEVVYRRYFRLLKEKKVMPDLLVMDGGKQQIDAAKEILDSLHLNITLCGLVKDDHHKTNSLMDQNGDVIHVLRDSSLFFLLIQMQEEVHRFAITYHRKLRNKSMTKSILDEVNGLGEVRKKEIWKKFKSLKQLKIASIDDIAEVVPKTVAINIYDVLHPTGKEESHA